MFPSRCVSPLILVAFALSVFTAGCGDAEVAPVSVSGFATPFHLPPDGRIDGAEVWILEHPEMRMTTGPDGFFSFEDLRVGEEVTLVMEHPDYTAIQTGTITLGPEGAERVTFQAVVPQIYEAFASLIDTEPDPEKCQMVTTVTRVGKSILDSGSHGEAGATVTIDPLLSEDHGPIYFNSRVLPDRSLAETSNDGGVLYVNVDPGEYVWTAT